MQIPSYIQTILDTFEKAGYESYLVGGCVRDFLLSRPIHDYDLCTNALPIQVQSLFSHTIPTGILHGTITILEAGQSVECTTYRKEKGYSDNRHPDHIDYVSSLSEDLLRRDFTINALAYHPKKGIVDVTGGQKDLHDHIIRAIGDPSLRFQEDALRMIRAHRFAAVLHFQIEEKTREAIHENADLIKNVAVERIVPELDLILKTDPIQIRNMLDLLEPWIPELKECVSCSQHSIYHTTNVLDHTLQAIQYLPTYDQEAAWALLLHDLGKPSTKTTDTHGLDHFKGHPKVSAQIARRVVKALKMPKKTQKMIETLVLYHDDVRAPSLKWLYKYRIQLGMSDEWIHKLFLVQYGDIMAHSQKGQKRLGLLKETVVFYEKEKKERPLSLKDLAINGNDIKNALGVLDHQIGNLLKEALDHAFYHPEKNNRADLLSYLERRNHSS